MAVKIKNEYAIRKAKRWNEKDDAALAELLHKKVREVNLAIKEASSPYTKSKLKAKKAHYKKMEKKVASGTYNGDVIFSEMQAAAALRSQREYNINSYTSTRRSKKYLNSYEDMDFDYEFYFRKTRYFGVGLPIIMTILSLLFVFIFIASAVLPKNIQDTMENNGVAIDYMYSFKLDDGANDFRVKNDGNWPEGKWKFASGVEQKLAQGEKCVIDGEEPELVYLYKDLGMRTIEISAFDVTKAWFRTKMLSKVRLDFLEDQEAFQGTPWFYAKFIDGRSDNISLSRNEEGKLDFGNILRFLATYGSILLLIFSFICGTILVLINLLRIFTYTSRRLHVMTWLALLSYALALILPAIMQMEGTEIVKAFTDYFKMNYVAFSGSDSMLAINIYAAIPAGIAFLMILLPFIFKNRLKRLPTYVPDGNKPRKQDENMVYGAYNRRR